MSVAAAESSKGQYSAAELLAGVGVLERVLQRLHRAPGASLTSVRPVCRPSAGGSWRGRRAARRSGPCPRVSGRPARALLTLVVVRLHVVEERIDRRLRLVLPSACREARRRADPRRASSSRRGLLSTAPSPSARVAPGLVIALGGVGHDRWTSVLQVAMLVQTSSAQAFFRRRARSAAAAAGATSDEDDRSRGARVSARHEA